MKNISHILKAGLLVGTLDILAACLNFFINTNKEPSVVFKFIASGVFGTKAFSGGTSMIIAGLVFHYIIAIGFTFLFFLLYPKIRSLINNSIVIGILYGAFVWSVMKFIVVPLSSTPPQPFTYYGAAIAMGILIICIGIPLSIIASKSHRPN
jgi:uncharacterized membrane protein YagU involved in acid resistance